MMMTMMMQTVKRWCRLCLNHRARKTSRQWRTPRRRPGHVAINVPHLRMTAFVHAVAVDCSILFTAATSWNCCWCCSDECWPWWFDFDFLFKSFHQRKEWCHTTVNAILFYLKSALFIKHRPSKCFTFWETMRAPRSSLAFISCFVWFQNKN